MEIETGHVEPIPLQKEMKDCYLDYAMSVIIGRALPDARDGLKPVHRRILYAMHILNNTSGRPYLKSARVVGDVIGKYHPHGEAAVYNAIVRMAQDFSLRYMLVDGQGNFGSIDGDEAAAMRYTEVRMKKISEEILKDIDKETVGWGPNYDDSLQEPQVLPTRVPNLLINGSTGIAVGMATNIPPHNLREIIKGLIALLNDPGLCVDDLLKIIPGPDFPTAAAICGTSGIIQAYRTGRGVIQVRAKYDIEPYGKDRERIVVTELPYQVNKAKVIEKIAELVNSKTMTGISDIRDESNRLGIRICIDLKKGEIAGIVVNKLLKTTSLQSSFGIIFLSIHNGEPKVMNIKEQLQCFLDHRHEVIVRRTVFELAKARDKAHILEGLKVAVENMDAAISLIKKSEGPSKAKMELVKTFDLSEKQGQAILDMRLQKLTGLERGKILKDYKQTMELIEELKKILSDDDRVKEIIRGELDDVVEKYGDERRTEIIAKENAITIEDLIKKEEQIVTITHKGYIKRMAISTYRTQKRGGSGVKGALRADDDFYTSMFVADTHATIYFFTNRGLVFSRKVYDLPEGGRNFKGKHISGLISIPPGEKLKEVITVPGKEIDDKFLFFATERGWVKKSRLSSYKMIRQNGLRGIKVQDGDSVCTVRITDGNKYVLLCSSSGKIIRFPEKICRPLGRVSRGVRGIALRKDERMIGMEIIDDNMEILCITENGIGKRTKSSRYRVQGRGGKGILAMKLNERAGDIIQIKPVTGSEDIVIITNKGQVIRTKVSSIPLVGRISQGVKAIRLKSHERVVAVEKFIDPEQIEKDG